MNATALLDALRSRGISLSALDGKLAVHPATALTPSDREAIRLHLAELLSVLGGRKDLLSCMERQAPREPWDLPAALRMMFDADTLVERLGVSGRDPSITAAARRVVDAHRLHDMFALRSAVKQFERVVRQVHLNR